MTKLLCFIPFWLAHCEFVHRGRDLVRETYVLGFRVSTRPAGQGSITNRQPRGNVSPRVTHQ